MNERVNDLQFFFKKEHGLDLNEQEILKIKDTIQEILSFEKYYPDDLNIQKGDIYLCIKTHIMENGLVTFVKGEEYISPESGYLLNKENKKHGITRKLIIDHFRKVKNLLD